MSEWMAQAYLGQLVFLPTYPCGGWTWDSEVRNIGGYMSGSGQTGAWGGGSKNWLVF